MNGKILYVLLTSLFDEQVRHNFMTENLYVDLYIITERSVSLFKHCTLSIFW